MKREKSNKVFSFEAKISFYLIIFILLSLGNSYILLSPEGEDFKLTGNAGMTSATVSLIVEDAAWIEIASPLNITYNFYPAEDIEMNLSVIPVNFIPDSWWFSLYNYYTSSWIIENSSFSPNITFIASKGLNTVYVYSNSTLDREFVKSETFFVNVSNSAPIIYLNSSIYVCEDESLFHEFIINDEDLDNLSLSIDPSSIFFMYPQEIYSTSHPLYNPNLIYGYINGNANATTYVASAAALDVSYIGGNGGSFISYLMNISVADSYNSDIAQTNITLIEINNLPEKEILGVQTIWTHGADSTFLETVSVNDSEDSNEGSTNITFNISFNSGPVLFGITNEGLINFTADNSTPLGIHNLSVCTMDTAIPNPYSDILSYCNQTGLVNIVCEDFTMTITDSNRPPTIIDYFPNLSVTMVGERTSKFNVTTYDPDFTIPDVYWYVDSVQKAYYSGNSTSTFNYAFACDLSGSHEISILVTDGLLNDTLAWNVNLIETSCPLGSSGGGGGGGGSGCVPQWVCSPWATCQNAKLSLDLGVLTGEDYRLIQYNCEQEGADERFCGFQTKTCTDALECDYLGNKPDEIEYCYYTENPSCSDSIKNCHDGSCEVLVDCGGPCDACSTCTDGIQNQKEEGVDCGGPCPWKCAVEQPFFETKEVTCGFILIVLFLLALIINRIIKIIIVRKKLGEGSGLLVN